MKISAATFVGTSILLSAFQASGSATALGPPNALDASMPVRMDTGSSPSPSEPPPCPSTPLRGVYDPSRLQVLKTCQTFRGTVLFVKQKEDGDYHVVVKPDPGYADYLNEDNYRYQGGGIVAEIMPGQDFPQPFPGEHIEMFGTWVLDTDRGWNEIHPIWAITNLATGARKFSMPVVPPAYSDEAGPGERMAVVVVLGAMFVAAGAGLLLRTSAARSDRRRR